MNWLKKIAYSNTSCKIMGHQWKRKGLRYEVCVFCGAKKKVRWFVPPRL